MIVYTKATSKKRPRQRKYKQPFKEMILKDNSYKSHYKSLNSSECHTCKIENPEYTGDKLIGIAVMHKSNLVPVFSEEYATDLARMRR